MRTYHSLLSFAAIIGEVVAEGNCGNGFKACTAPGSSATTPQIGSPEFQNLLVDIVQSSLPASQKRSGSNRVFERASSSLCCNALLSCLTMSNLALPFCYDKFTTNYVLPDGSSGTVASGTYRSPNGDTANLETGDYTLANGSTGNIYAHNPAAKPNTATLPIPTPYTAAGIGSAVPVSNLASIVTLTYTTTIPGTTIAPQTLAASTLPGSVSTETLVLPASTVTTTGGTLTVSASPTLSLITLPESVVAGTTISGSTIAPMIMTITTTQAVSPSSTKKSGAARTWRTGNLQQACSVLGVLAVIIGSL